MGGMMSKPAGRYEQGFKQVRTAKLSHQRGKSARLNDRLTAAQNRYHSGMGGMSKVTSHKMNTFSFNSGNTSLPVGSQEHEEGGFLGYQAVKEEPEFFGDQAENIDKKDYYLAMSNNEISGIIDIKTDENNQSTANISNWKPPANINTSSRENIQVKKKRVQTAKCHRRIISMDQQMQIQAQLGKDFNECGGQPITHSRLTGWQGSTMNNENVNKIDIQQQDLQKNKFSANNLIKKPVTAHAAIRPMRLQGGENTLL